MEGPLNFKHTDITEAIIKAFYTFGPKPEIKRKAFDNSRKGSMRWRAKPPS